ncbi:hypothetical protein AXE77_04935 [Gardnerella vaginalis]|uniref:DUF881 domain-containing protein n=1 Tax=Gardnerella vaginalis TaxID=2702 RepID=A0A3E1IZP6_GARVA|nr:MULTISPECIES: DUF881 domain-containing protein [Gardnerella]RFD78454.1 hypothetical protein AXE77_04935 [Gardnerella vaginalis]
MVKQTGKHGAPRSLLGSFAVAIAVFLTGYLFVTNLRVNKTAFVTSNTSQMVELNSQRTKSLREDIKSLDSKISLLNKTLVSNTNDNVSSSDTGSSTVLPKLQGPGIVVTLNDSPLWKGVVNGSGTSGNINDYVIHQQDIESVVNALWRGGAEAMTIQDQRVLFNTAVICIGNVLMLQGHQYSPPYKISAIGPVDNMVNALNTSPAIRTYKEYVSSFGLGWKVEKKENLRFPESSVLLQPLQYATVSKELGK